MTWAEFRIRLHGYLREQDREWFKVRELAWITYIAPYQDPKKMKRSKEAFWPMKKKKKVTDEMRQRIIEAQKKYLEEIDGR